MRHLLPAAALAVALAAGVGPAAASSEPRPAQRVAPRASHVALHLSRHGVLAGGTVVVRGRLRPSGRHRVRIVFRGRGGRALEAASDARGRFRARWSPPSSGPYAIRAFRPHDRHTRGARSPVRHLTSYRYAGASYYGPGLYGNGVACGGTLTPSTLGVANRTLPCGTMVRLRYHGRSVTVPVIDRGPYVAGRDYDLTEATRNRLGFPGVDTLLADH
jgi:peptidoglycan lytic transglycosylase